MAPKASAGKKSKASKRKPAKKLNKSASRATKKKTARSAPAKKSPARGGKAPKRAAAKKGSTRSSAAPPKTAGAKKSPVATKGATPPRTAGNKGQTSVQKPTPGSQAALDLEIGPTPAAVAPPELPTPKRRNARQGGPDWPGENLTVGMPAPDFELPSTLGRKVTLKEFRGKRVILYFYPKDDTPGCTMEACAFRDNLPRFDVKEGVVLGVSLDDELSHQRFLQKYNLNFPLLSDVDAAVSRQYGVYKEKNLYGRSFWGIERTTFVIDREGKVENVFRRVKVEGHADEVLATLAV
jgi:peroxiredoxin Q/BCP